MAILIQQGASVEALYEAMRADLADHYLCKQMERMMP